MKKILLPIILIAVVVAAFFLTKDEKRTDSSTESSSATVKQEDVTTPTEDIATTATPTATEVEKEDDAKFVELEPVEEIRPATELYNSAEEAFNAIKKGSESYDDSVLEQFSDLEKDCRWCDELYNKVQEAMLNASTEEEQRSYFAEILASSGKPENIAALISAMKDAKSEDDADTYLEALEITMGDDKTVDYLSSQLDTDNEKLKSSLIAAITNHGTPLAIETLYEQTVQSGDTDGYYSLGIGLGEVIPDEESLPFLTELVNKRDQYSHLAVKALLNYGVDGLRVVFDTLELSSDAETDRKMLKDAIDHVSYEEETEAYAKEILNKSKNPVVQDFAREIIKEFDVEDLEDEEDDDADEE